VSAEDFRGARHYAYFKNNYLVSIHLHGVMDLLPGIDPEKPETVKMPGMHAILFGNPGVPTLLMQFSAEPPDNLTAWAISPNVYMIFQNGALSQMYITDVYSMIAEVD
jgi:hypothetical protein